MNSFFPSEPVANEQPCCDPPGPCRESPLYKALSSCENAQDRLAKALAELLTRIEPLCSPRPPSPAKDQVITDEPASTVTGRINKLTATMRRMAAKVQERTGLLEL